MKRCSQPLGADVIILSESITGILLKAPIVLNNSFFINVFQTCDKTRLSDKSSFWKLPEYGENQTSAKTF